MHTDEVLVKLSLTEHVLCEHTVCARPCGQLCHAVMSSGTAGGMAMALTRRLGYILMSLICES